MRFNTKLKGKKTSMGKIFVSNKDNNLLFEMYHNNNLRNVGFDQCWAHKCKLSNCVIHFK